MISENRKGVVLGVGVIEALGWSGDCKEDRLWGTLADYADRSWGTLTDLAILSDTLYLFVSFRKSTPSQNRQFDI